MTPHRSASTNITGYSYVSQDRLLATTIKVVGTFDGESISRYGFQWALDGNNWHDVVLYNGSWTNVMNITAEKNIKISALQGSIYLRSFITRKDTATTYSPTVIYRYNNVMRLSVTGLIENDFTSRARASEINAQDGYQYVVYDPATDEITGFDTELGLVSLDLRDTDTTELGRNAFKGCSNLETVYLPSTLQVIGENAFVDNEKITSVDTYNVSEIGDNAFKNCVAMESLVLGEEVTEIGDNAFNGCSSLTDVTSYALEPPTLGSNNFTTSGDTLYVPNEALSAYQNDPDWSAAFSTIRPLQEYIRVDVVAGDHGTASGSGWYEVGDTVVISATADTGYHFTQWNDGNTDNPRTITVGATDVTYTASFLVDAGTVGNTSYSSLTYTSVTCSALFSGLDTTGYGFCYSTTNSSPDLNDTVVTIGTGSINATASASLINLTEATKYYIRGYITNAGGTSYNTAIEVSTNTYTISYTASSEITGTWVDNNTDTTRNTYDSVSGNGVLYLNAGVSAIGGGDSSALSPFYGNSDLASADLTHSNIRILGSYTFYNCENMTTVDLGSTVTTIGNYTFYHCEGLESIDLTGITSIGNNAFNTCSSLETLTIPSTVTIINDNAFDNCTSLETLVLPSTLQRIGVASFGHCDSLASVTCYATSVPTLGLDNFTIMNDTLYVPYESVATYLAVPAWQTAFVSIRPIGDYSYITVNNGGHGTTTGGGWYLNGTYAQISATPDSHYHFVQWGDGDTNATRSVLVTQDEVYSAVFAIDQHTITVSAGDHGSASGSGTYDYGSTVQISATPDTDYHFTGWNDGNTDNPRTITVTGDATYTASFSLDEYTLTVTGDAHTTVTGSGTYPTGTSVQIEATPDSHYHFVQWSDGNTDNPRTITVTSNITLSASSAIDTHTITVTSDAHGTASGSGTYVYGVSVGISITPDSNYHFVQWNDGNTSNPRSVTVTGDATYSGTTAIDQFTLTVTGDLNTTVTGSGTYDYGTSVQITATPNTHYHFVAWSDGDTNATRTVVVTSNITLSATSAIDTYSVTVTGDANTDTTSGSGTYGYGSSVQISATPVAHYHFARWQDNNTDNPRTITVTSDVTYTATTAIDQHVITTQGDSHIASVTGGGLYDYGTQVTLTATPDTGYHFVQWTDGNTDNPRTITVTEDATYRATSALNIYTITVNGDAHTASTTGSGQWGYGSQFQISATPDSNYHFVAWNDGNTDNPRYITVTGDATYTASMAIDTYTLTVLSDDVNEGSVSGGGTYDYGTSVQISATAESGYEFTQWNDGNTSNPRTVTVTANATYTAYFQASVVQYTIGVYSGDPNVGSVTGGGTYNAGATCTIEAFVEDPNYEFDCWQDDDTFATYNDNPYSFTVSQDINFTANFIPYVPPTPEWTVTLNVNDPTMGTVDGDGTYMEGVTVSISAYHNSGYVFDGWYQNGVLVTTLSPYSFEIYNDEEYEAHFSVAGQTYDVTLYSDDPNMGNVVGDGTYNAGTDVEIEAIPNGGYVFSHWLDTLTNVNYDNPATILNISQDESWTAFFEAEPQPIPEWTVTLNVNDSNYGSVSGDGTYDDGDMVTITATPAQHCLFEYWYDDDNMEIYSNNQSESFYIDSDKSFTAHFAPDLNSVTVEANNSNYGTTNPSGTSQSMYWIGVDTITMEATPNTGYYFDHWEQSNGTFVSSSNPVTVVTSNPATYIAVFVVEPVVNSITATNVTETTATVNANVTGGVGDSYTITVSQNGSTIDSTSGYLSTATETLTMNLTGLTAGTTYTVDVVVQNAWVQGTGTDTFTTVVAPSIGVTTLNNISYTTMDASADINATNTFEYGFVYGTSSNPTVSGNKVQVGSGSVNTTITGTITNLIDYTTYYVRAYVTTSGGTTYYGTQTNGTTLQQVIRYVSTNDRSSYYLYTVSSTYDSTTHEGAIYLYPNQTYLEGSQSTSNTPFYNDSGLTKVDFSGCPRITSIGSATLYHCTALQEIILPPKLTAINKPFRRQNEALDTTQISNLTSIKLPSTLTSVGEYTFGGPMTTRCPNLTTVVCEATTPPSLGSSNFQASNDTLYVPSTSVSAYQADSAWVAAFTTITSIPENPTIGTSDATPGLASFSVSVSMTAAATTEYGFVYSTSNNPTISDNKVQVGTGTVNTTINTTVSSLTPDTTYYVRAYVTNVMGTFYGEEDSVIPLAPQIRYTSSNEATGGWVTNNTDTTKNTYNSTTHEGVLYLNSGVTTIGTTSTTEIAEANKKNYSPFYNDTGLIAVDLDNSGLTSIDGLAFDTCENLTSVNIPEGVTRLNTTGAYHGVFIRNYRLHSVTLPTTLVTIGHSALNQCFSLEFITIPASVTTIGTFAFYNCSNLRDVTCLATTPPTLNTNNFNLANSTLYVPSSAFNNYASNSTWNVLFTHLAVIGVDYFIAYKASSQYSNSNSWIAANTNTSSNKWNSTGGRGFLVLKSDHASLGGGGASQSPFYQSTAVEVVHVKFNSKNIDSQAFYKCTKLTQFKGEGVTCIGQSCFRYDTKLKHVVLSADVSVTGIASHGFGDCTALVNVYCYATTPPSLGSGNFPASSDTLYVPSTAVSTYQSNSSWNSVFTTITSI